MSLSNKHVNGLGVVAQLTAASRSCRSSEVHLQLLVNLERRHSLLFLGRYVTSCELCQKAERAARRSSAVRSDSRHHLHTCTFWWKVSVWMDYSFLRLHCVTSCSLGRLVFDKDESERRRHFEKNHIAHNRTL